MTSIPKEFESAYVSARASAETHMYREELLSKDPMASVLAANPEIHFVAPKRSSEWGQWELSLIHI